MDVNFGDSQRLAVATVEDALQEKHHVEPCKTKSSDHCYTEEHVQPQILLNSGSADSSRSVNSEYRGDNDGAQLGYM